MVRVTGVVRRTSIVRGAGTMRGTGMVIQTVENNSESVKNIERDREMREAGVMY